MLVPLVGSSYAERSLNLDAQTCINFYEVSDPTGKFQQALYPTPGLRLFSQNSGDSVRGVFESNNELYAVIDREFCTVSITGLKTKRGTLNTSYGRVYMESNGLQIMIVDGSFGYVYTLANKAFEIIVDENFRAPIVLTSQDGYGIYPQPNSQFWWLTNLFDFKTITATDFSSANGTPDNLVSVISTHQEVWLFSQDTAEVWFNTGDANFTFQRRPTLLIEYGCVAPYSVTKSNNGQIFWISRTKHGEDVVVMTNGYVPQIISTPAIKQMLQDYETIEDAFSFCYEMDGYIFLVMIFPTADRTLQYNITLNIWNELRSTLINALPCATPTRQGRWRPNCYTYFKGKHIVGDFESGNLYEITPDEYTENGFTIIRERVGIHLQGERERVFINGIEVIVESGVGDNQTLDPKLMLSVSKDSGHSFGIEVWRGLGKQGKYNKRVNWLRLGYARDWLFKFKISDPVKCVILAMRADIERGVD